MTQVTLLLCLNKCLVLDWYLPVVVDPSGSLQMRSITRQA
jgi:hypothetical protein